MSFSFSDFSAALKAGAPVTAEDVLALRRWVWPDGVVSESEAEALFALNRQARDAAPEWDEFFVEAISEHVLDAAEPHSYVDDPTAAWLIGEIERGGAAAGPVELELVVKILEKALNAPASLKAWALREVETAVLTGEGATRRDGPLRPGVIDEAEVKLLRRLVFAGGGDGALVVSDDEAELLWRLKEATLHADNGPGWKALFVQAIGNHLMAWSGYKPLERVEAARLETFMNDRHSNILGFLGRMRDVDVAGAEDALHEDGPSAAEHDASVAAAQAVTPVEQDWLQSHIAADGARDPYEEALLAFIAEESGQRLQS
ncbi:MAG: hypothetical protein JWO81_462 [Alphaproteobacteria bacterium]|nr:hypothetical protein [Alphaproteobacteria bacterium]